MGKVFFLWCGSSADVLSVLNSDPSGHLTYFPFQHEFLTRVKDCLNVSMTVDGRACSPKVLDNEITCKIPKDVVIPPQGAAVQVQVLSHSPNYTKFSGQLTWAPVCCTCRWRNMTSMPMNVANLLVNEYNYPVSKRGLSCLLPVREWM